MNFTSNIPEIQSPKLILQLFPRASSSTIHSLLLPSICLFSRGRVSTILESLDAFILPLLARKEELSSLYEFRNIEILGESLRHIHRAETIGDGFCKFSILKSWMFCIEVKTTAGMDVYGDLGAKVVRLHFYGSLEAMISYVLPSCRKRLKTICGNEIPLLKEELISDGSNEMRRLMKQFWSQT